MSTSRAFPQQCWLLHAGILLAFEFLRSQTEFGFYYGYTYEYDYATKKITETYRTEREIKADYKASAVSAGKPGKMTIP